MTHAIGLRTLLLIALASRLMSQPVYAYSLKDHRQLTEAAFQSIERCFPGSIEPSEAAAVVSANLWEDKNLIDKWFKYSHFYQPRHEVGMLRENSQARVRAIQDRLDQGGLSRPKELDLIGALLHHVQDMTVPLHVMPVNHFWTDGFEKLAVTTESRLQFDSCETLLMQSLAIDAVGLHHQTAVETYEDVLDSSLQATSPQGFSIPLTWFWEEGTDGEFGSYGLLGNAFGKNWLSIPGQRIRVENLEYSRYKFRRLKLALRVSQLILVKSLLSKKSCRDALNRPRYFASLGLAPPTDAV